MRSMLLFGFVAVVTGCAHQSARSQTLVTPAAEVQGDGVSTYRLPDGEVRVAMMPMVQMPALWIGQASTRAIHVRLTFDNVGMQPWTIYSRQQIAHIGKYGPSLPAATSREPLIVAAGQVRTLDLYYPVPVPSFGPVVPTQFSLDWNVLQPGAIVAGETRIDPTAIASSDRARF